MVGNRRSSCYFAHKQDPVKLQKRSKDMFSYKVLLPMRHYYSTGTVIISEEHQKQLLSISFDIMTKQSQAHNKRDARTPIYSWSQKYLKKWKDKKQHWRDENRFFSTMSNAAFTYKTSHYLIHVDAEKSIWIFDLMRAATTGFVLD